jgi:hypothetical protein
LSTLPGLFIPAATLQAMPMTVQLVLGQPLILGTVLLIVLNVAFRFRHRSATRA